MNLESMLREIEDLEAEISEITLIALLFVWCDLLFLCLLFLGLR